MNRAKKAGPKAPLFCAVIFERYFSAAITSLNVLKP